MSNQLFLPNIVMRTDFTKKRKTLKGPTVKFELRDEPNNVDSGVHEKKVVQYDGEYGDDNAKFWCQFEAALREVFRRKPCATGPSKYGVLKSCLTGKALNEFEAAAETVGNETNAHFEEATNLLKETIFEGDTPRYDQIEYIKTLKKPRGATLNGFVSEIDQMVADLRYFPSDLDGDGNALDDQPTLEDDEYKKVIIKSAPRQWFEKLTDDGSDPRELSVQDIKRRFRRMERREQHKNRRDERKRSPKEETLFLSPAMWMQAMLVVV